MKTKWLAVLLVLCMLLIVPIISSCSCNGPDTPVDTDTEGGGNTDKPVDNTPYYPPYPQGSVAPTIKYLRVSKIDSANEKLQLKLNVVGDVDGFVVKTSASPITDENFASATEIEARITGSGEVKTITITDIKVDKENMTYIAVQASEGDVVSTIETVRAGGIAMIGIDCTEVDSIYSGEVIKDLTPLIDEQTIVGDPLNGIVEDLPITKVKKFYYKEGEYNSPTALDPVKETHERYGTNIAPIIDLKYIHYVECVMLYYGTESFPVFVRSSKEAANFNTSEAWDTETKLVASTGDDGVVGTVPQDWTTVQIGGEARYIQVEFKDGQAPTEVIVYGYALCETEGLEIGTTQHKLPTLDELMGQCGLLGDGAECTPDMLACATVLREYHNFGWSYAMAVFPKKSTMFKVTAVGNFDKKYKAAHENGILIIPCIQWTSHDTVPARNYDPVTEKLSSNIASWDEKYLPESYIAFADLVYQYAARYGSSKMGYLSTVIKNHSDGGDKWGLGYIQWIECGNEPNGEDEAGLTPYQCAALQSASYDGHQRTILSDIYNNENMYEYFIGAKNADPDIKVAMAGLAGIGDRYITSMCYWLMGNRTDDGSWTSRNDWIAMDAFNVHTYFGKYYNLNGQNICVGVSPEEYGLVQAMSGLVEYRDKYFPDVEVWLTEFGWDTNQSYETMTSAHAYGEYSGRDLQAMWLVRSYLLLSSCGVDKATMYMCEDLGNDRTAIGKYGTCGIFAPMYTEDNEPIRNPETNEHLIEAKPAYYYMYTLKKTLGKMTFIRELDTGDPDVWVYQYADKDGNVGYAVWCPTSNGTKVNNFKLKINDGHAYLVETSPNLKGADYEDKDNPLYEEWVGGKKTDLITDKEGYVTINVSENPVYVVVPNK